MFGLYVIAVIRARIKLNSFHTYLQSEILCCIHESVCIHEIQFLSTYDFDILHVSLCSKVYFWGENYELYQNLTFVVKENRNDFKFLHHFYNNFSRTTRTTSFDSCVNRKMRLTHLHSLTGHYDWDNLRTKER